MAPLTPRLVVPIDVKKKPWEQKIPLHNRWHPNIPPVADVTEGELFRVEMVDWTGGRIRDDNSADDIKFLDLTIVSLYFCYCQRSHLVLLLFYCFHGQPN
jgi:formamidase